MKTILFVCTGNLCRSPMAAGLMRQRLAETGLDGQVQVRSAGIYPLLGQPASEKAVRVMAERGIDISQHQAQGLNLKDIQQADIILVMEEAHRRSIFYLAPEQLHKVFLLSEVAGQHHDVKDPYGQEIEAYRRCADELASLLDAGFDYILEQIGVTR
ncbi:MAG TPA: low molecular weight protein arginine phosphatase [Caldilineae bacterium]|nr:low molecular weight protein arginine phosphatase [Caldilineae bacterium]